MQEANAPHDVENPPVQQQPVFALAPGLVTLDFLDYSKQYAQKLFKNASAALSTTFDMKPENLKVFLSEIQLRSITYGWESVIEISDNPANINAPTHSLLTEYGCISMEKVKANVSIYHGQPNRAAQDDRMIYT
jgi:phenylpyruvate tautomerase PptA (4-oxalocrotonate tautomerase family)